ncbi:hypothetical protein [Paenibacillus mendelii]|uniref:Uncharacterized protein n=1 Tax=Paenibacillus mendelii TaxID=206163 RepID=A0ABV6JB61_9BACL|nr:hypothetical protein [Paenibacillus mendelii]MCQ6562999.1 hypothetical protein [Paenibacillus mendelii]
MKNYRRGIMVVVFLLLVTFFVYRNYSQKYAIEGTLAGIDSAVGESLKAEIKTHEIQVVDNKLFFVFTMGSTVGSGELKRGLNNKYAFESAGYGTNDIRERIVETSEGQYLFTAGRNDQNIGKIKAYIEDGQYELNIPQGEYYVALVPVQATDLNFVSGLIVIDREGNEIYRRNVPESIS